MIHVSDKSDWPIGGIISVDTGYDVIVSIFTPRDISESDFLNGVALLERSTYHVNDSSPTRFQQRFQDLPESYVQQPQ